MIIYLTTYRYLIVCCFLLWSNTIIAQILVNYQQHIAPIIIQHCLPCHSKGGDAPFSLTTYEEVSQKAATIAHVTANKYMPPYPADPQYSHFINENYLPDNDIALIQQWVATGKIMGKINGKKNKSSTKKKGKYFNQISPLNANQTTSKHYLPNKILPLPSPIAISGDNKDRFERVLLPYQLEDTLHIAGFKFYNSHRRALHHSELMFCRAADCVNTPHIAPNQSVNTLVGDALSYESLEIGGNYSYLSGWLPGQKGDFFPEGFAKTLYPLTSFLYLLHYAPSPIEQIDTASVQLYSSNTPQPRSVESVDLHATQLFGKGKFVIPADTIITLHSQKKLEDDFSVFAIMPHAHHLAQKMLAYAVTLHNDTVPLLKINQWRFAWQLSYKLPQMLVLPRGTTVHFWVTYNNTVQNPENPYHPPREVGYSFNADSEMMELFLLGSAYQAGDEKKLLQW